MSTKLSTIFNSLRSQQLPALIGLLEHGGRFAEEKGIKDEELLELRLTDDMHPLRWQIQTVLELILRSAARVSEAELPSLELTETSFDDIIDRAKAVSNTLDNYDFDEMDANAGKEFEIPIGPDAKLTLTGQDYVLKFFLPNFYFHLTTTYALLRQQGVPIGKLQYMGPVV